MMKNGKIYIAVHFRIAGLAMVRRLINIKLYLKK